MRLLLIVAGTLVTLLALSSCGVSSDREGRDRADEAARQEASDLTADLYEVAWHHDVPLLQAQVPSEPYSWGPTHVSRDLLSTDQAEGQVTLVVRVTAEFEPPNNSDWSQPSPATVALCFRYDVTADATDLLEVTCPAEATAQPIPDVPEPTVTIRPGTQITDHDRQVLRAWLADDPSRSRLAALTGRLGLGLTTEVSTDRGLLAVAVSTDPAYDGCLLGRLTRAGRIQTWSPDRVVLQPGEAGCVPELAIHPALSTP